jgi:carboxylate-amine ligase
MGVEEELLLVDRTTGVPVPVADDVLAAADLAGASGAHAAPLASAPLPVTPHPRNSDRFQRMVERFGALPRHTLTCGLHVHVGIGSDAEGVAVLDRIRTWLPVLIAMSANSPFQQGEDTQHASYRTVAWNQWPSAGPSERFGSAHRYRAVCESMLSTGALLDPAMLYLDARLSRAHPTVEVRVADVPMDPGVTVTIAGLVRALVDTAVAEWHAGVAAPDVPACTIRLANWRAALGGIEHELVHPVSGRAAPATEVVMMLLEHVLPALTANGDDQLVERGIADLFATGTGAARQRAVHATTGDLAAVTLAAAHTSTTAGVQ